MNTDHWTVAKQAGNERAMIHLIKQGHPINGRRGDYFPPLIDAASLDMRRLTRLLLDRHADPNITDPSGRTALHWTAILDYADLCAMLIRAGADVAASDGGSAPIHYAANNSPGALKTLLDAGVDLNLREANGLTALHKAAQGNWAANVAALLVAGADPHARDHRGQTPLDVAQGQAKTVLAQFLAEVERQALEVATGQVEVWRKMARL